jgi:hypothetical protein
MFKLSDWLEITGLVVNIFTVIGFGFAWLNVGRDLKFRKKQADINKYKEFYESRKVFADMMLSISQVPAKGYVWDTSLLKYWHESGTRDLSELITELDKGVDRDIGKTKRLAEEALARYGRIS